MPAANDVSDAPITAFPPNSRYHGTGTATCQAADGRVIVYLQRRFVPPQDSFQTLFEHTVRDGDRLDLIAAQHLGDPLLFWRLCDANGAMKPDDLLQIQRISIVLPEGIEGVEL
jgi:hypothetical protein